MASTPNYQITKARGPDLNYSYSQFLISSDARWLRKVDNLATYFFQHRCVHREMNINLKCAAGCFFRLRHAQFEAGHGLVMLNRSLVRVLTRLGFEPTPVFLHLLKELYKDALSTGLPQPQQGIVNLIFCRTEPLHIQILILYLPLS